MYDFSFFKLQSFLVLVHRLSGCGVLLIYLTVRDPQPAQSQRSVIMIAEKAADMIRASAA